MAKESIAEPLTQFIGTGPYLFKERKPDQYTVLVRFDDLGSPTWGSVITTGI